MLSYRNHDWMLRHGPSRFEAYITAKHREPKDVMWSLALHYMAAGACWRRVREYERPQVELGVSSWKMKTGKWQELAGIKFWDEEDGLDAAPESAPWMPRILRWQGGWMDVCYKEGPGMKHELSSEFSVRWQVRERQGARFLVELAADPNGLPQPPAEERSLVLSEGQEEEEGVAKRELSDFWKQHATMYALEQVPFGKVLVRVPRNVQDVVGYARRRAFELLGVSKAPEAYQVNDFLNFKSGTETETEDRAMGGLDDDVYVKLHFNAYHEDE